MKVPYSYLKQKFSGYLEPGHPVYENKRDLYYETGAFTLGPPVEQFEKQFAELLGVKYAIGVANGTDALELCLRAAGVGPGDEVITAANTFIASAGAIGLLSATPRFVDMAPWYTLDADLLEAAITPRTKAILPVHFTGEPCEMDQVMYVANKHGLPVIEDACQAQFAEYKGRYCGSIGLAGAFSFHPLKILNCCADGGAITTNDKDLYEKLLLLRNHGLKNRDEIAVFPARNSRLDSDQAITLNYQLGKTKREVDKRRSNAFYFDQRLKEIDGVNIAPRRPHVKQCFHLYFFEVDPVIRNDLLMFLNKNDIEAKVHYPKPLQGLLEYFGHSRKDFPNAYRQSDSIITLPVDEFKTREQQDYCVDKIAEFMHAGR